MEMASEAIVNELTQGRDFARQLEAQLDSGASVEFCRSLAKEILASFEKATSMVKTATCTDSPRSFTESPHSESSHQPFKSGGREMATANKKRKTQGGKQATHVKLGTGPEAEGPVEDGYNWRKYGQKEILGAKNPRGYYRCTHRNSQGCPAIKQMQRSDENPSIFEVTYRGTHTCRRSSPPAAAMMSPFPDPDHHHNNQQLLLSFQSTLKVETQDLDPKLHEATSSSFLFPSTPINSEKPEGGHGVFSLDSTLENCFKRSFTDAFISPATSESNYFSYGAPSLQASESDFTEIVSRATLASNSSMLDDFLMDLEMMPF